MKILNRNGLLFFVVMVCCTDIMALSCNPEYAEKQQTQRVQLCLDRDQTLKMSESTAQQQYDLAATCFAVGERDKAQRWFELSAQNDIMLAQMMLGVLSAKQQPQTKEGIDKADNWLQKTAATGNADALFVLGLFLDNKESRSATDKLSEASYVAIEQAAQKNHQPAQIYLGWAYLKGNKLTQNTNKALYWYERTADIDPDDYSVACTLTEIYQEQNIMVRLGKINKIKKWNRVCQVPRIPGSSWGCSLPPVDFFIQHYLYSWSIKQEEQPVK